MLVGGKRNGRGKEDRERLRENGERETNREERERKRDREMCRQRKRQTERAAIGVELLVAMGTG